MLAGTTALLLSTLAGLGTALGGVLVVWLVSRDPLGTRTDGGKMIGDTRLLGPLQALSAGVMMFISFFDILPEAMHALSVLETSFMFFVGMAVMALLEYLVPDHLIEKWLAERHSVTVDMDRRKRRELLRASFITFTGMALHNAPEGVAVYVSTLKNPQFGMALAIAIFCHNIPEGCAVGIPLYYATGRAWQTVQFTLINGLFEPAAVLFCCFCFGWQNSDHSISEETVSRLLAAVAGIMTLISLSELYPSALHHCCLAAQMQQGLGRDLVEVQAVGRRQALCALIAGMLLGFIVLVLFQHH